MLLMTYIIAEDYSKRKILKGKLRETFSVKTTKMQIIVPYSPNNKNYSHHTRDWREHWSKRLNQNNHNENPRLND